MIDPKDWEGRIWVGDCLEFLPFIESGSVHVITDPPYGIADVWKGGTGHGWARARAQGVTRNGWDNMPPSDEVFLELLRVGKTVCIWGGNHFPLPPSRGWLVWNKPERGFTLSEAELAWTNRDAVVRVYDGRRSDPDRWHPTQKTEGVMSWCMQELTKPGDLILDPFLGSGTTAVVAERLGRRWIGCEINEEYAAMAEKRIQREREKLRLPIAIET